MSPKGAKIFLEHDSTYRAPPPLFFCRPLSLSLHPPISVPPSLYYLIHLFSADFFSSPPLFSIYPPPPLQPFFLFLYSPPVYFPLSIPFLPPPPPPPSISPLSIPVLFLYLPLSIAPLPLSLTVSLFSLPPLSSLCIPPLPPISLCITPPPPPPRIPSLLACH